MDLDGGGICDGDVVDLEELVRMHCSGGKARKDIRIGGRRVSGVGAGGFPADMCKLGRS